MLNKLFLLFSLFLLSSCKQSLEQKEMERLLNSLNTQSGSYYNASSADFENLNRAPKLPPSNAGGGSAGIEITNGVPNQNQKGYCGDGIINGDNEHCDRNALLFTQCSEFSGGLTGDISCSQDCHFNISDCITAAVDKKFGGRSETCKCNCDPALCQGACAGAAGTSESTCFFDCRRKNCTCQCEDLFEFAFNGGNIQCRCVTDSNGAPNCACSLDQIEGIVITKPNLSLSAPAA